MFKRYQALGKAIKSVKTNVPQTKKEKLYLKNNNLIIVIKIKYKITK